MGVIDSNGVYKYSAEDTVSTWDAFLNLGMNSVSNAIAKLRRGSVYKAASIQAANALRDSLVASGVTPSESDPILVYMTKDGTLISWDGQAWKKDGNALASSTNVPATASSNGTTNASIGTNYLFGVRGPDDKLRMEAGTAVVRIPASSTGYSTGQMPLQSRYTGIATAILTNGDPYASGNHVISAAAYDKQADSDGLYSHVPYKAFGQNAGGLIRINYIVMGWVK